jgi:hypothetical protein
MESSLRLSAVTLLKKQQGSDLLSVSLFNVKRYHGVSSLSSSTFAWRCACHVCY